MNRNLKILLLGLLCAVVAYFFLDHPLGVWFRQDPFHGDIRGIIGRGEWFGHGYGILMVMLMIYALDRANRYRIPRVAACAFLPGLAVVLVKVVVNRTRPRSFDFSNTIDQTFTGLNFFTKMSSAYQSFPSGHTATAVGLAVVLSRLYPHGRNLFAFFAVWVALQRMFFESHFLSDTICGALLGYFIAKAFLPRGPLSWGFDKIENAKTNDK